jgi:hypothetical protein
MCLWYKLYNNITNEHILLLFHFLFFNVTSKKKKIYLTSTGRWNLTGKSSTRAPSD